MENTALTKLLSPLGWNLLNGLPPYDESRALTLGETMRKKGIDPELAAAVLTQSRLRAKAEAKFGEFAARMLFTQAGLEQATRLEVAAHHAHRFRGTDHIADLTCGIGGDAMAFAALESEVTAIDNDEATAAIATVNLAPFPNATVVHADSRTYDLPDSVQALWADPARRSGSRRVFKPADFTPALDEILARREKYPALGVKIAPGIPHDQIPADAEAQWISVDGDVVEAVLWFGPLAQRSENPGATRSALLLSADSVPLTITDDDPQDRAQVPAGPVGSWVHEPDGAIIRAGLVGAVAREVGGHLLDESIAYVTTNAPTTSGLARRYRVLDHFPFHLKKLRADLRERQIGKLEIKKRGTALTPEELRSKLALQGPNSATIILTRIAGAQSVLVVARDAN